MLQKLLLWFIHLNPSSKRWFWRKWYNVFARKAQNSDFRFMNYGYDEDGFLPDLSVEDEEERYPIHLYHHVATQVELIGKKVLEVGSGRGGGASYLARYLSTESVHGIDLSSAAIELCEEIHAVENLSFSEGDSEDIPFDDGFFDIVLNVESSHCYGDVDQFLSEAYRVLKPGGYFLWCDLRSRNDVENVDRQFRLSGLEEMQTQDITTHIISALEKMSEKRKDAISSAVPRIFQKLFESYAGVKDSRVYNSFKDGSLVYLSAALKRPE